MGGNPAGDTSFSKDAAQEIQKESLQGSRMGFLKMFRQTGQRSSDSIVLCGLELVLDLTKSIQLGGLVYEKNGKMVESLKV